MGYKENQETPHKNKNMFVFNISNQTMARWMIFSTDMQQTLMLPLCGKKCAMGAEIVAMWHVIAS